MTPTNFGVPNEIVSCISAGREPSVDELFRVAERIQADWQGHRFEFSWRKPSDGAVARDACLRAAHAALCGTE